jgi:microcystin-dependent protein
LLSLSYFAFMDDVFVGETRAVGFGFAPHGGALGDGALLPINRSAALLALTDTYRRLAGTLRGQTVGGSTLRTTAHELAAQRRTAFVALDARPDTPDEKEAFATRAARYKKAAVGGQRTHPSTSRRCGDGAAPARGRVSGSSVLSRLQARRAKIIL